VSRAELDALGALPNAAFAIAAAPGFAMGFGCRGSLLVPGSGGQHGYLPSHPRMPTGFIVAGAGVRAGVVLERVRLVDIAPTAARLLASRRRTWKGACSARSSSEPARALRDARSTAFPRVLR